jgi:hypothetical protein
MMTLPAAAVLEGRLSFDEMPFTQPGDKEKDEQVVRDGETSQFALCSIY